MEKIHLAIILLMEILLLCSCEGGDVQPIQSENNVNAVLQQQMTNSVSADWQENNTSANEIPMVSEDMQVSQNEEPDESVSSSNATEIDVDLTQYNSTMAFSEIYNMLADPDSYIGKTVRIHGTFNICLGNPDDSTMQDYYFLVTIMDATACCQQAMEFVWTGDHTYPDDYPTIGSEITVTGVFKTYEEGGNLFCHLIADDVEFN